jgi:putative glutathione S-transferase
VTAIKRQTTTGASGNINGSKISWGQRWVHRNENYTGRATVPVLWDRKTKTIVNNESSEIIRMLNTEFDAFGDAGLDLYPAALRPEIDEINRFVYDNVNNGVYRAGLAKSQEAYEQAFRNLFAALDELEARLSRQRWLVGGRFTEADLRLFPTLIRFDTV